MRISRPLATSGLKVSLLTLTLAVSAVGAGAGTIAFTTVRDALKQGVSAYQGGYYEIAIPALEHAAAGKEFLAEYYLARIYADNSGPATDHAKAYMLFQKIADEYADVDPDDDPRAVYVGKSLTALASYVRQGLPEIGLVANVDQAVLYLRNASSTFNDEDAQFEIAKLQLRGEGVDADEAMGRHWLSVLSEQGHAGAQAFLADLLWRGKYMPPDKPRALALIAVAVENAPLQDRLWIEDIYQNIFCGSGEGIRRQATGIVAEWGNRYGRKPEARDGTGLGSLTAAPVRTCQNGEQVGPLKLGDDGARFDGAIEAAAPSPPAAARPVNSFSYGSSVTPTAREIDAVVPTEAPRGDR